MRLFVMFILGVLAVGLVSAPPASADCSAPSMTFSPRDVDRGGEVTAIGKLWGDNCYDTGPPPAGQGVLGQPLDDIEIILVQGEREWVVGTVDADDDYGFVRRVIVPQDAAPGDAQLLARWPGTYPFVSNPDPVLRISAAPPVEPPPATDSAPSPSTLESDGTNAENADESGTGWLWAAAIAVASFAAGAWAMVGRRRST